ncbi:hypothetical protein BMR86_20305, partial [Stenotrophomonas sp. KAs 5-3]
MASRPNPAQLFARVQADDLDGALQAGLMDYVARADDAQLLPGHPELPQRLQQAQQQRQYIHTQRAHRSASLLGQRQFGRLHAC